MVTRVASGELERLQHVCLRRWQRKPRLEMAAPAAASGQRGAGEVATRVSPTLNMCVSDAGSGNHALKIFNEMAAPAAASAASGVVPPISVSAACISRHRITGSLRAPPQCCSRARHFTARPSIRGLLHQLRLRMRQALRNTGSRGVRHARAAVTAATLARTSNTSTRSRQHGCHSSNAGSRQQQRWLTPARRQRQRRPRRTYRAPPRCPLRLLLQQLQPAPLRQLLQRRLPLLVPQPLPQPLPPLLLRQPPSCLRWWSISRAAARLLVVSVG